MADVFISYSRSDGAFVRRLVDALERNGKSIWIDTSDIRYGEVFTDAIRAAIEQSDAFVFVVSPGAARSAYCRQEVEHAVALQKRCIPVMRAPADDATLPPAIREIQWIPFTDDGEFDTGVERLVATLDTDLDHVREHTRWLVKALEWQAEGRDRSFLLRGAELAAAERWRVAATTKEPQPTPLHDEYLLASRAATSRRQRAVAGASVAVAAVSVTLLVFALIARSEAISQRNTARSRALVAQSETQFAIDPRVSLLLAVEAYRTKPTLEARSNLIARVHDTRGLAEYLRVDRGIRSVAFDATGRVLAGAGDNGRVALWDARRRRRFGNTIRVGTPVVQVLLAPDDSFVVVRDRDARVRLWDVRSGRPRRARCGGELLRGTAVALSRDGSLLALGGEGGRARVCDVRRGALVREWRPAGATISALAFRADRTLAAGRIDGRIALLRVDNPRALATVRARVVITDLAFAPDGSLAAVSGDGVLRMWRFGRGRPRERRLAIAGTAASAIAFGPSGDIAVGAAGGIVLAHGSAVERLTGTSGVTTDVGFSPDGRTVASATTEGGVAIWDPQNASLVRESGGGPFFDVAFGPDDHWVAATGTDPALVVANAATARIAYRGTPPAGDNDPFASFTGRDVAFGSRGRVVARDDAGSLVMWSTRRSDGRGRALRAVRGAGAVDFSPDGKTLAWGTDDGAVIVWNVDAPSQRRASFDAGRTPVTAVGFSGDGRLVAAGSRDGTVRVWDFESRAVVTGPLQARSGRDAIEAVAISPDDATLATADGSAALELWRFRSRPSTRRAIATGSPTTAVAFDPSGRVLASAGAGGVDLWDVDSGERLGKSLRGDYNAVADLAFARSGRLLAAATDTQGIVVFDDVFWSDATGARTRLCRIAGGNLTRAEWARFLPWADYRSTCGRRVSR